MACWRDWDSLRHVSLSASNNWHSWAIRLKSWTMSINRRPRKPQFWNLIWIRQNRLSNLHRPCFTNCQVKMNVGSAKFNKSKSNYLVCPSTLWFRVPTSPIWVRPMKLWEKNSYANGLLASKCNSTITATSCHLSQRCWPGRKKVYQQMLSQWRTLSWLWILSVLQWWLTLPPRPLSGWRLPFARPMIMLRFWITKIPSLIPTLSCQSGLVKSWLFRKLMALNHCWCLSWEKTWCNKDPVKLFRLERKLLITTQRSDFTLQQETNMLTSHPICQAWWLWSISRWPRAVLKDNS